MAQRLGLCWQVGAWTGWGVYGLNLLMRLAMQGEWRPILVHEQIESGILNPLHRRVLAPIFAQHSEFKRLLDAQVRGTIACPFPVLHALGNHLDEDPTSRRVRGDINVGVVFFEDAAINSAGQAAATSYDVIVAGSEWNAERLREHGIAHVRLVRQGVDRSIFHPAPRAGLYPDRFVIFSGGKLEYRKGQDIVIAAFRAFRQRHPEALLLTAWHNAWPSSIPPFDSSGHVIGLPKITDTGRLDVSAWLRSNGLPAESFIDLGPIPNWAAGEVLREADVAVFPNRCEGGTNLVAMEAMACGVPCILSANTGHLDLMSDDACFAIVDQDTPGRIKGIRSIAGWGESSVDNVVERMEEVFIDRREARRRGMAASRMMDGWSWGVQIDRLMQVVAERA